MPSATPSQKPLLNKTILVACSAKKMVELVEGLGALGGNALPLPVIEVQEIEDKRSLDDVLASLVRYSWIIFTSAYAVTFFLRRMQEHNIDRNTLSDMKICAVGPATASALKENGLGVALVPKQFVAEGVLQALEQFHGGLQNLAGCSILLPRAKEARDVLPNALRAAGAKVEVVPCYQTVKADFDEATIRELKSKIPDLVVFTSSSTVRNLIEILGPGTWEKMRKESTIAALGPITASTVESFGKCPAIVPKESTVAALLEAIRQWAIGSQQSAVGSRQ